MPEVIKAISLHQPYADLIALGYKKIETRTWRTSFRGRILICSTKMRDFGVIQDILAWQSLSMAKHYGYNKPLLPKDYMPRFGVAVATAELFKCSLLKEEDAQDALVYAPGKLFGFFLRDVQRIKPFRIKGRQGLYDLRLEQEIEEYNEQKHGPRTRKKRGN